MWERAAELDPDFPTAWRNLGFGYFNKLHDSRRALETFARARALAPGDARIFYEFQQLKKKTGEPSHHRLADLEANRAIVQKRDDLSIDLATLYNDTGRPEMAMSVLTGRQFQPWEGGEGLVLTQYVRSNVLLGQRALRSGKAEAALKLFSAAFHPPGNLGETRHLLMNLSAVDYWVGIAHAKNGSESAAIHHWEYAARRVGDFCNMKVQSISEMTYWSALALQRLCRNEDARSLFQQILDYSCWLEKQTAEIDYFATSLPAMLLFEEDPKHRQSIHALYLKAQAKLGIGQEEEGITRAMPAQSTSCKARKDDSA